MASLETQGIIDYIASRGIPYKVTDITTPGVHAPHSYHYAQGTPGPGLNGVGLAVDFAGERPMMVAEMKAIFDAFAPVVSQLAELIHNEPGITMAVKDGRWVNGLGFYGGVTWAAHTNHVHVSVHKGTILAQPRTAQSPPKPPKVAPMYDPPLQIVADCANPTGPGAYGVAPDGGVFALGGAPWRGIDHQPLGKDYWAGRKAARIEVLGNGYAITSTSGERYEFP